MSRGPSFAKSSASVEGVSSGFEAFILTVHLTVLITLDDAEVRDMFCEPEIQIVKTFHFVVQQSLINTRLMKTSDITNHQAYILYLVRTPHSLQVNVG